VQEIDGLFVALSGTYRCLSLWMLQVFLVDCELSDARIMVAQRSLNAADFAGMAISLIGAEHTSVLPIGFFSSVRTELCLSLVPLFAVLRMGSLLF
jgi:hypothetical protein